MLWGTEASVGNILILFVITCNSLLLEGRLSVKKDSLYSEQKPEVQCSDWLTGQRACDIIIHFPKSLVSLSPLFKMQFLSRGIRPGVGELKILLNYFGRGLATLGGECDARTLLPQATPLPSAGTSCSMRQALPTSQETGRA